MQTTIKTTRNVYWKARSDRFMISVQKITKSIGHRKIHIVG